MLEMAETEWDHERYFRTKASGHAFWRLVPTWPVPPPREQIRSSYDAFAATPERPVQIVRAPWLIR